jgi:hypothetical protein
MRKMYNDAGVNIYAFKLEPTPSMSDEEYEYIFHAADALGANHVTLELSNDAAFTQRIGDFAAKKKMMVAYHAHTQATMTAWDAVLAQSKGNAINLDCGHYVAGTSESPIPVIQKRSHLPIIVDPSHAAGKRSLVPALAKAALAAGDVANTLYRLVQFAIREAVATRTLDEILAARDTIDREVRAFVTERAGALGVEIGEIGVKDVILPGDVRDLLNKVVEAERTAKANLIRRQEETAATRSLLNTARLMEDNPLLLRLKELEALEKLVEKVGRIDLHAGAGTDGFDALLQNLYSLRERADAAKPA